MGDGFSSPATEAYRLLLQQLDDWFSQAAARHPGMIPCRAGCSACCHGPFDISVADAVMVNEAVARLPMEARAEVGRRARAQAEMMRELEPDWRVSEGLDGISEAAFDRMAGALAAQPCPLLDDAGACRIYFDRPMICRMMGLGVSTPAGRVIENGCPIQDQFPDYSTLPPQPFQLEAFEELEAACLESASIEHFGTPQRAHFETTLAQLLTTL